MEEIILKNNNYLIIKNLDLNEYDDWEQIDPLIKAIENNNIKINIIKDNIKYIKLINCKLFLAFIEEIFTNIKIMNNIRSEINNDIQYNYILIYHYYPENISARYEIDIKISPNITEKEKYINMIKINTFKKEKLFNIKELIKIVGNDEIKYYRDKGYDKIKVIINYMILYIIF